MTQEIDSNTKENPAHQQFFNEFNQFRDVYLELWENIVQTNKEELTEKIKQIAPNLPAKIDAEILNNQTFIELVFKEYNEKVAEAIQTIQDRSHYNSEKTITKDEAVKIITTNPSSNLIENAISSAFDIWQEKETAGLDHLTGLGNQSKFLKLKERLNTERKGFECVYNPALIVMFDLDDFKKLNDAYGHAVGDEVLKVFGASLLDQLRPAEKDMAFRVGGEEFLVILPAEAESRVDQIRKGIIKNINSYSANQVIKEKITISAGYCITSDSEKKSADEWQKLADSALYLSKKNGKDRTTKLDPDEILH